MEKVQNLPVEVRPKPLFSPNLYNRSVQSLGRKGCEQAASYPGAPET